jgi:hypothetical protein
MHETPFRLTLDSLSPREYIASLASSRQTTNSRTSRSARSAREPPSSSRSSRCSELKPLFDCYSAFCTSFRTFIVGLPPDVLDPEFSLQFTRFTAAFDLFARQATVALATPQRIPATFTTSPLFVRGRSVLVEWTEFLAEINKVSEAALAPHVSQLNRHFGILFDGMNRSSEIILSSNFRSDAPQRCLSELKPLIVQMRDICANLFLAPKSRRFDDFYIDDFEQQILRASRLLANLFDRHIHRAARPGGEISHLKAEMVTSLAAIVPLLRAVQNFDPQLSNLKRKILRLNGELSSIHERFELPFAVELALEAQQRIKPAEPVEPPREECE